MESMLKNMGTSAWGLFDLDDQIELIETRTTDAHKVFDEMVKRCNSELSKLFLGQTATMDEQSFVGTAEVQERVLEKVGYADEYFIENVLNTQLVPMLSRLGMWKDGNKIKVAKDNEFTLDEKSKFDIELLKTGKYTFTPEYLYDNYGSEVLTVVDNTTVGAVKNSLNKYYK
jgi:phage gp29-like protein